MRGLLIWGYGGEEGLVASPHNILIRKVNGITSVVTNERQIYRSL